MQYIMCITFCIFILLLDWLVLILSAIGFSAILKALISCKGQQALTFQEKKEKEKGTFSAQDTYKFMI